MNENNNWRKPKLQLGFSAGYLLFQIVCVFAEYDRFKPTISIQNGIYMNTVLYQFL